MIYSEINGQKLGQIKTADFVDIQTETIFFAFMDKGRAGVKHACQELVGYLIEMMYQRGELNRGQCNAGQYAELELEAQKLVVNGLIQQGTAGIHHAIHAMYVRIGQIRKCEAA